MFAQDIPAFHVLKFVGVDLGSLGARILHSNALDRHIVILRKHVEM